MAVKLVYGDRAFSNAGIMFRRFGGLNSRGTEAVEIVNVRNRTEYGMVGPWAVNDAFAVFNGSVDGDTPNALWLCLEVMMRAIEASLF